MLLVLSSISVSGNADVTGDLSVGGDSSLTGNLDVTGTLSLPNISNVSASIAALESDAGGIFVQTGSSF